ncbi:MAG: ThuA domain-containing protein [Candidatus Omnitrophica bacterium]|nr:hypothetical protein [bacterium]NUN95547.1 ThuA domain-containing protein [Candidatus Omnitrophota bacterium]
MALRKFVCTVLLGAAILGKSTAPSLAEDPKPKKLLVLTFCGGFKHSCLEIAEKTIAQIGRDSGVFEAEALNLWQLRPDLINLSFLTPEYMNRYDGFLFFTTTGDNVKATEEQKQGILNAIKDGKALIGTHTTTDSFYNWPEWGEMVGAYFDGHPWNAGDPPVTLKVEDKNHPATAMLGDEWVIQDEIYQFREPYSREKLHVLLSLDNSKTDMEKGDRIHRGKDGDYAVAWCREYGKGKVFYTALGHREDVWTNPTFQAHLLGGIKWAFGLAEGDATPSAKLK